MNTKCQNTKWIVVIVSLLFCIFMGSCSKQTFYTFFQPKDYYQPIVKGIIDVSKENTSYTFAFINKYEGKHSIGIAYSERQEGTNFHRLKMGFEANIKIYQNGKEILSDHIRKAEMPYLFGYNKVGGFHIFIYKTPADLPVNVPLTCTLEITKGNPDFERKYGKAEFFIRKFSDK